MLSYLFLLAAAAASPELSTIDLTPAETSSVADVSSEALAKEEAMADRQIQELVAVLAQEENALAISAETPETTETAVAAKAQPITITNAIEPSMLEYKHWTGKYSPEKFAISINGTEIEAGKTREIPPNTTSVEIGYTYSFMNGMKTGGRKISYQLNENITQANITFNWKDDWRVIVDNGKAVKEISS